MYHYSICNVADEVIFQKQCRALEIHLPHFVKGELLEDVDGLADTAIFYKWKIITVHNSKYIDAVYIDSEVELKPYFKGKKTKSQEVTALLQNWFYAALEKNKSKIPKKNFKKLFQNEEKCAIIVSEPSNRTAICGKTIKKEVFDMEIKKQLTTCPKEKPKDESKLGFGHIFTDHMLVMPYDEGQAGTIR